MKFIPILFSTPMVQSIMAGNKRMTRRKIKNNEVLNMIDKGLINNAIALGKYRIGDILWVRETFVPVLAWSDGKQLEDPQFAYRANTDAKYEEVEFKWKPGIHMPKSACRLFLKIKSVNIERLKDISKEDAIAEGIENVTPSLPFEDCVWRDYNPPKAETFINHYDNPINSFMSLWEKINGNDSWYLNPYVWVIEFEKIEKPESFL